MKAKEIRSMSKEDLDAKLNELKKELIKLNAQISTGTTPKSPGQVRQIKKNIARILTIMSEKSNEIKEVNRIKVLSPIPRAKPEDSKYPSGIKKVTAEVSSEKNSEVDKKT